jgi:hypothetical protein
MQRLILDVVMTLLLVVGGSRAAPAAARASPAT